MGLSLNSGYYLHKRLDELAGRVLALELVLLLATLKSSGCLYFSGVPLYVIQGIHSCNFTV